MLTGEMKELIFLLKEVSYMQGYAIREQSFPESSRRTVRRQLDQLQYKGLLRVVTPCSSDALFSCYALSRPLQEISLYDILCATGGLLQLPVNSSDPLSDYYGLAGRRLSVLESMIYRFLSEISLVEVVLPDVGGQLLLGK